MRTPPSALRLACCTSCVITAVLTCVSGLVWPGLVWSGLGPQATAILTAAAPGAGGTPAAAAAASLLRPWLAQLLGCLEVTLAHAQSLATCGGAGAGDGGSGGGGASSCSALQPLVAQAGVAAVELLQVRHQVHVLLGSHGGLLLPDCTSRFARRRCT